MKLVYQYIGIFFNFKPHYIIFIHYKSRIAAAIRGLLCMWMTMVHSGLKGSKHCYCEYNYGLNINNCILSNFAPREFLDRGSETQPQLVENVKKNN